MKAELETRLNNLLGKMGPRKEKFEELLEWLKTHHSYFTAPASPRYHLNCEEGLLEHSINVAENMIKIKNVLCPEISDESCVIVGLMHDLGKGGEVYRQGTPEEEHNPYYLIKEPTDKQKQYGFKAWPPFEYNSNIKVYMSVPERAITILLRWGFSLTDEEVQAVRVHDGQYVDDNKSYATKECKLALIAHYADSWAGFTMEPTFK